MGGDQGLDFVAKGVVTGTSALQDLNSIRGGCFEHGVENRLDPSPVIRVC
jgi:hypothetical protein